MTPSHWKRTRSPAGLPGALPDPGALLDKQDPLRLQGAVRDLQDQDGPGGNRNFKVFDPLDFLAAVTSHIPNRGEHLVRYYGCYSSVQRGRRRRQGRERMPFGPVPLSDDTPHPKAARASWARFIMKVFAADPLECPDCGGAMRIIAFIEDQRVVRAILVHPSLWDEARPPPVTPGVGPRAPAELEYLPWVE